MTRLGIALALHWIKLYFMLFLKCKVWINTTRLLRATFNECQHLAMLCQAAQPFCLFFATPHIMHQAVPWCFTTHHQNILKHMSVYTCLAKQTLGPYIAIWREKYLGYGHYSCYVILQGSKQHLQCSPNIEQTSLSLYCIVLYCIVLYCIVLYCIVLYCIVLYCIVLYCIVLYCIVLYCIVLYCIVLYCIVLYCIVLYCIVLYCIVLYCIVLYCIVLYCIC